ncbi:hypothetical protein BC835DRAFT_201161 [Cytidiella melzeri]|nr:hypothetical protein BC835DRAFT_201161 [Cytidiella melzeri]
MPFMFFSVARSRLFIASLLALSHVADAHLNTLFTSSVSYCAPPESILIQQFDVAYFEYNRSVVFNISAASVLPNVSVSANLFVNVYGMRPINISLDLCTLLHGALCPLPTYNFTGADSVTLPDSINVASALPGIAYKIPDLEAFVQLTLTEVGTGKTRACIQATVSNGWSTHQTAVEWTTGGIALLALISAVGWSYVQPESLPAVRLLDLIYLFQSIAASSLLALNYPIVFRSFALNFAWSLGLFSMSPTSSIQNTINRMRSHTGGDVMGVDSGSAVSLVNRKLSPYNTITLINKLLAPVFFAKSSGTGLDAIENANVLVGGNVATVTQESSNILQAGIPIYTNFIGIATANAFMTIFFISLIFIAIAMGILGLGYLITVALARKSWGKRQQATFEAARIAYPDFARAWGLRVALICVVPVFIFAFYQWTLHDSWAAVLLSVILLLAVLLCIIPPIAFILRPSLFSRWIKDVDTSEATTLMPLTASLRSQRYYYILAIFIAILVKSLVIAFGQAHGMVQTIVILVVEVLLLAILLTLRPFRTRGADVLSTFLSIFRVTGTGLMIAFSESVNLQPIPRVAIGIVIAVIYSVAVVIMFFNTLVNIGLLRLLPWKRNKNVPTDATALSSHQSLEEGKTGPSEKSSQTDSATPASSTVFRRPHNPEPSHTPSTPSSMSPTTTLSRFSEPPTIYTPTTATTTSTLGEQLPHRWSFQHSRPPSASAASHYSGGLSPRWPITPGTTDSEYATPRESWRRSSSAYEHPADRIVN